MKLKEDQNRIEPISDEMTSKFLFGEFSNEVNYDNLPSRPFGLLVNADKCLSKEDWEKFFRKLLESGTEWFSSYGENSEIVCDIFDLVYLDWLEEKGETEDANIVLITIWCKDLAEAMEQFDLINHDRHGDRMQVAVVLE